MSKHQNKQFATHNNLKIMKSTGFYIPIPGNRQGATTAPLTNVQGVQPFQIVSQTNQGPLAPSGKQAAQGKLTKAQHFLDDANHGFDRRFAQAVEGFANGGTQLVSHLFRHRSIFWRWVRIVQKKGTPTLDLYPLLWTDGEARLPCDYRIYNKDEDGLSKNDHF